MNCLKRSRNVLVVRITGCPQPGNSMDVKDQLVMWFNAFVTSRPLYTARIERNAAIYFSYRQAQAAVLEGLPRLQSMGIPTRRPDDYMAEMAKSDVHMKKVLYWSSQ